MQNFEIVAEKDSIIAQSLANCFGKQILTAELDRFADTESIIKISDSEKIKNKTVFIVQQFFFFSKNVLGGNTVNNQLFKLLLLIDLIKKNGSSKIVAVLPYLPYARQDKTFDQKHVGAINLLGKVLGKAGLEEVICVDLHDPEVKDFFEIKLTEIDFESFWVNFLKSKNFFKDSQTDYCLVSPDKGRLDSVKNIASKLNVSFGYIEKTRIAPDQPVALKFIGDVKGKEVIVLDDIIDTARTAVNACDLLLEKGAKRLIGCFAHAVLTQGALERLEKSRFDKIFVTNSLQLEPGVFKDSKVSVLSIDEFLCDNLKKIIE